MKLDITERHDVSRKLSHMMNEYIRGHNRYPEIILLDAFSCKQLINENQTCVNIEMRQPLRFMGINILPIETEAEVMMFQRSNVHDVIQDAEFHARKRVEEYHRVMRECKPHFDALMGR